jgi:tetratricopeptide (TPR) repeat protein
MGTAYELLVSPGKPLLIACAILSAVCFLPCQGNQVLGQVGVRGREVTRHSRSNRRKPVKAPVRFVSLTIVSKPSNCRVYIGSEPQEETNANGELKVELVPGNYSIRVSCDGYITKESDIEIYSTPPEQRVEFILSPSLVNLNVVTDPPGAEVYLDDVYKGATGPNGLLVLERVNPSQPHTLRARKDGYVHQSTPVTSNTGQVSIKLMPDSMRLKVVTDPSEAEVYLDEAYKGTSTSDGSLIIEQVNPNQLHTLRAKKDGYRQESTPVPPNSSQANIKLSPDPVLLLIKDIRRLVAQDQLAEAYSGLDQLTKDAPDHQELPRLSESLLQGLQTRTTEMSKRVAPFGLVFHVSETQEMRMLYRQARKLRPGDENIENLGKFWDQKLALLESERAASTADKDNSRRDARTTLIELAEHNVRNPYVLLDTGWSWWKLNERNSAAKNFKAALELKPDWAYPHFALGVLFMNAADLEKAKSAKSAAYLQAIGSFNKAISFKHDFASAYAMQALSYALMKKPSEAIASGLQAVAVDPQNALAHFALGSAYFEKGKSEYRSALSELNRAVALGGAELDDGIKNAIQQRLIKIKKSIK